MADRGIGSLVSSVLATAHFPIFSAGAFPVASHIPSAEGSASPLLGPAGLFEATGRGWSSGPWLEALMSSRCGGGPAGPAGVGRARAAAGSLEGIWAANEHGI